MHRDDKVEITMEPLSFPRGEGGIIRVRLVEPAAKRNKEALMEKSVDNDRKNGS